MASDEFSLFLIAGLVISLCGGLLLLVRDRDVCRDALTWWAWAMLLGGAGVLLMAGEGTLPPLLHSAVSRALLLLAAGSSWTAARAFSGRRPSMIVASAGAVAWLALDALPAFYTRPPVQTATASFIAAVYVLATAGELLRGRAEHLRSRTPAVVLLLIHVVALLARGWLALEHQGAVVDTRLTGGLLLESMFHTIGMALLLVSLTKERAQALVLRGAAAVRGTSEARSRFLAHMSHELRTPLNGLLGFAQVLARDPKLSVTQREQAETMERAGRHLLSLANDALDLMRIDAGRLELDAKPLNLTDVVTMAETITRGLAAEKHIDLLVDLSPGLPTRVLGDRTRLQQILLNLLSNAVKFTPVGGQVRLTATAAPTFGVVFEVADSGPGVPEEKRALLFHDFMRLASELTEPNEGGGTRAIDLRGARPRDGRRHHLPARFGGDRQRVPRRVAVAQPAAGAPQGHTGGRPAPEPPPAHSGVDDVASNASCWAPCSAPTAIRWFSRPAGKRRSHCWRGRLSTRDGWTCACPAWTGSGHAAHPRDAGSGRPDADHRRVGGLRTGRCQRMPGGWHDRAPRQTAGSSGAGPRTGACCRRRSATAQDGPRPTHPHYQSSARLGEIQIRD